MHFQHKPADVMMVDFAGDSLSYVLKETGEVISCPVLVCVLPYSGYSYVSALVNASLVHVVKALNECLNYFQGVPHSFKSDNMKQIVTKSCRYEPTFTDMMQQWALHNNIALLAARVRKPKDKASVENEVKLTYQRIYAPLRDKVFFSLEELNRSIKEQLAAHHQLPFQKKAYNRYECFIKEEKPLLQSLPLNIYVIKHYAEAKVQKNYHITLGEDWNHYSVPFIYIGKKVNAIYDSATKSIVILLSKNTCLKVIKDILNKEAGTQNTFLGRLKKWALLPINTLKVCCRVNTSPSKPTMVAWGYCGLLKYILMPASKQRAKEL
jgi:hypothetical protein